MTIHVRQELTLNTMHARDIKPGMNVDRSGIVAKARQGKVRDKVTGEESQRSYVFLSYFNERVEGKDYFYSDTFAPEATLGVWQ